MATALVVLAVLVLVAGARAWTLLRSGPVPGPGPRHADSDWGTPLAPTHPYGQSRRVL